eukprot:11738253-Ditylum_brightwellii.AAC.1
MEKGKQCRFESYWRICSGHIMVYIQRAMKFGAHTWATAPGSNPGQSAHFSGGEKQWQVGRLCGV